MSDNAWMWGESQEDDPPALIGPGTGAQPAAHGPTDPGDVYKFGPNFVAFVTGRFAAIEQMLARHLDIQSRKPQEGWRFVLSGNTDNTGALKMRIFNAAPNQRFSLHRLYIEAKGYTWAAPYTGTGQILIQINGLTWSGYSLVSGSGQIPAQFTAGSLQAVEVQDGEEILLNITGGPASTEMEVRCQGVLSANGPGTQL